MTVMFRLFRRKNFMVRKLRRDEEKKLIIDIWKPGSSKYYDIFVWRQIAVSFETLPKLLIGVA